MTATERLRQLLDERGVEWIDFDGEPTWMGNDRMHYARQECSCDEPTGEVTVYHLTPEQAIEATLGTRKQPPYEELIEALRRDWDIEASWDGLRRFWYVGLTDEGVRKRDEREATLGRDEVADLRQALADLWPRASFTMCPENRESWLERLAELRVEVES